MSKEKIVTVNFDAIKAKATTTAKNAASTVGERLAKVTTVVKSRAKAQRDQVVATVLDKGIALSEKQLKSLRKVRKSVEAAERKR